MSARKLAPRKKDDYPGPRRNRPKIRAQRAKTRQLLSQEDAFLDVMTQDATKRRELMQEAGVDTDILVYVDNDQTWPVTELGPNAVPLWKGLTESFKFQLGFMALARLEHAWSFTANLHPDVEAKWVSKGMDPVQRVSRNLDANLRRQGLRQMPYGFVMEGKSKRGRSRSRLHIHGYFGSEDRMDVTRFKVALEATISTRSGRLPRRAVRLEPSYEDIRGVFDPTRWPAYILKNAMRRDNRLPGRRIFENQELKGLQREFHRFLREEPL